MQEVKLAWRLHLVSDCVWYIFFSFMILFLPFFILSHKFDLLHWVCLTGLSLGTRNASLHYHYGMKIDKLLFRAGFQKFLGIFIRDWIIQDLTRSLRDICCIWTVGEKASSVVISFLDTSGTRNTLQDVTDWHLCNASAFSLAAFRKLSFYLKADLSINYHTVNGQKNQEIFTHISAVGSLEICCELSYWTTIL